MKQLSQLQGPTVVTGNFEQEATKKTELSSLGSLLFKICCRAHPSAAIY